MSYTGNTWNFEETSKPTTKSSYENFRAIRTAWLLPTGLVQLLFNILNSKTKREVWPYLFEWKVTVWYVCMDE